LPIKNISDFIFLACIFLAFALYRPNWTFLFFIGTIALENINLAPENIGIAIRPYQFFATITFFSVLVRFMIKETNFKFPKFLWIDNTVIFFVFAGFSSAIFSADKGASLKLSLAALSFATIYFLTKIFIRSSDDLKKVAPFFLNSSVIVILYGIWQNARFAHRLNSFEIMPGRPNSTFAEADWLGIYLGLLIAVIYTIILYLSNKKDMDPNLKIFKLLAYIMLITSYILLILTVSRSAWVGVLTVTIAYLLIILTNLKLNSQDWQWKKTFGIKMGILLSLLFSIFIVYFFNLTSFQLFNRIKSTNSGLQKITVSCNKNNISLPEKIDSNEELAHYGCRHINLEEINFEQANGYQIKEIYRPDPNINLRREIYQKSWQQIKAHPILGIGWGSIGDVLGYDKQGSAFNSSNIFLEIWLGAGILGLASFIFLWSYILVKSAQIFYRNKSGFKTYLLFILIAWIALTIPNLFNAGIFLGFFWIFLGISISLLNCKKE
jgi:hypothetical protein